MGLDVTYAIKTLQDIREEHKWQMSLLDRNALVLDGDYPIANMFNYINDNLCYESGMVRFEYMDWSKVKRRVEGHVCSVDVVECAAVVKLLTEKGDMLTIFFASVNPVQLYVLPVNYSSQE